MHLMIYRSDMKNIINNIFGFFYKIKKWCIEQDKREIMHVTYDLTDDVVVCTDWNGKNIYPLCGEFSEELWSEITKWSRLTKFPCTTIYIWGGLDKKHLAYNEPIENYLREPSLLKTGNGYHFGSGKVYKNELK